MNALAYSYGYRFWEVPNLALVEGDLPPREQVPAKHWVKRVDGIPVQVPNRGTILTGLSSADGIGDCIWPTFLEWCPPTLIPKLTVRYQMGGVPRKVKFPNGSEWTLGSAKKGELSTEGTVNHWFWGDEPIPKQLWAGVWRGLVRNRGDAWFTLTPLGPRAAWLYHDFIAPKVQEGHEKRDTKITIFFLEVLQRDNPALTEDTIQEFENDPSFDEQERQARLYGKFQFLSHRVYPTFVPGEPFICEPFAIPESWRRVQVVDPHIARPYACGWFAQSPAGVWYWYRQWPEADFTKFSSSTMGPREYALTFRAVEGKEQMWYRLMDPNYGRQRMRRTDGTVERTISQQFGDYDLRYTTMIDDDLERGHSKLRDALFYNPKRGIIAPDNHPKLVIFNTVRNGINALMNYAYQDSRTPGVRSEKVSEEWKDFADLPRYLFAYDFPAIGEQFSYFPQALEDVEDEEW
jgi:hypothetical protein